MNSWMDEEFWSRQTVFIVKERRKGLRGLQYTIVKKWNKRLYYNDKPIKK